MTKKPATPVPPYRLHQGSGLGYVLLNRRRIYLGRYELASSRERYGRVVAEWEANGRHLPVEPNDIAVVEVCTRYLKHARSYYRKPDGQPTTMVHTVRAVLAPLRRLYGSLPAVEFGPRQLRTVRQTWINAGLSRQVVNRYTSGVRRVFNWAASEEIIADGVAAALSRVVGLHKGRSAAWETQPVRPVPEADIEAVRPHVSRQVWAMIQLQLLTGMRPGEVVIMRRCDLEIGGATWTYTPATHKTQHYGHGRSIYLGPRAQEILGEFLKPDLSGYLFSPRDAERERAAEAPTHRRPGQPRTLRRTGRSVGDRYTTGSYHKAVGRACAAAGVDAWSPNRLRHNAATFFRREYGIDVAQTILGHRLGSTITEVYAEANTKRAAEIVIAVG